MKLSNIYEKNFQGRRKDSQGNMEDTADNKHNYSALQCYSHTATHTPGYKRTQTLDIEERTGQQHASFLSLSYSWTVSEAATKNKQQWADLDTSCISHRLWGDVGLTGLSGDHGHPKNLLKGVSDCLHIYLLIWSHHNVDVTTGPWRATMQTHIYSSTFQHADKISSLSGMQWWLTDVWSHAGIQRGDHGLHWMFGFVQDRLYNRVTCYALRTHAESSLWWKRTLTSLSLVSSELEYHSGVTLMKPQMPPPVLTSPDTLGSSCSSGKVMGDPVSSPPVMAGCWTIAPDTTPGRLKRKTECTCCSVKDIFPLHRINKVHLIHSPRCPSWYWYFVLICPNKKKMQRHELVFFCWVVLYF